RISRMREDSADRIADFEEDHARKLADIREESAERLLKLEEDYQRDRERASRQHLENLLNAAARLDAAAVLREQRAFALSQREAEENYRRRVADERENLDERIAQENEAHQRRVEDERKRL